MPTIYHFHRDVGSHGLLNCGPLNGHDASCQNGLLTDGNEDACEVAADDFPLGKPHRCKHEVSADQLAALLEIAGEIDFWVLEP